MIIDNGERHRLIITSVFDGMCGLSQGVIAFTPNRGPVGAVTALGGLLDDAPVRLTDLKRAEDGRSYTASIELLA